MKEVSCRIFQFFGQIFRQRGYPLDRLFEGTELTAESIWDPNERFDWETYQQVERNFAGFFNEEELLGIGGKFAATPHLPHFNIIPRLLFTTRDIYFWGLGPKGPGVQNFSCAEPSIKDLGSNTLLLEVRMAEGYVASRQFFLICQGFFISCPTILGYSPATVTMEDIPRGARFRVVYSSHSSPLAWLRRALSWPLSARAAARELNDAHEVLTQRYFQLQSAKQQVADQEKRLRAAHGINRLIRGDLDFARTVNAISKALVSEAGFLAARISIDTEVDEYRFQLRAEKGSTNRDPDLIHPIVRRGRSIGSAQAWHQAGESREECSQLLAFILPTIAMALDDSIIHTTLAERTRELGEARDQLINTVQKLGQAEQARNRLFANINHDIRTPLSTITMSTSELRRHYADQLDERGAAVLARVDQSVNKLLRLVDGLLVLAASEEDKLALRLESCDVAALLSALMATWAAAAQDQGLALEYRGPSQLEAEVDEQALERIVANLVSNAIKFTPVGGRVDVELTERDGGVEISVRDTGVGIDAEFKSRIFGRFEKGRQVVRPGTSGSGIGLSIVKELVEAHQGRVELETPEGGGSLFRIWLPIVASLLASRKGARLQSDSITPAQYGLETRSRLMSVEVTGPSGGATVLVAEDDPELRRSLAELLSTEYHVLVAADGLSALKLAESERPDLLLVDVGMPDIDGFEITRRFRARPENRLSPVLLMSAYGGVGNRLLGFEVGAVDFVTKPFDSEELLARVGALLAFRAMTLKLHEREQLAALGALSASVAHEMRNPANAIVNAVGPLLEQLPKELLQKDQPVEQLVSILRDCAGQIALLSRELLGLERSSVLEREEHHVSALMQRCINLALPQLRKVDLRLDLKYDGTASVAVPLTIQVMTNLLGNAAQAAGAGGWVGLATRAEGGRLIIEVSDSSPGVPPTLRDRIFEPLFATKPPGLGSGLGLTTSREIAIQHGGTLEVRGTETGSVFRLELPLPAVRTIVEDPAT